MVTTLVAFIAGVLVGAWIAKPRKGGWRLPIDTKRHRG